MSEPGIQRGPQCFKFDIENSPQMSKTYFCITNRKRAIKDKIKKLKSPISPQLEKYIFLVGKTKGL